MEDLKKALETIALKNSEGVVSDDILVKACEAYKIKSDNFIDDYDYHICVAKSFFDYLNDINQDSEICKAIVPGQTKVADGVMYIYTATPNAKTNYDWRVYKGQKKIGKQVTDEKKIKSKQNYINDLFPKDLSSIKVIKRLGGSTGAQLVEDSNGNQFVMKKGSNTSSEHVRSEYLANQLYDLLGLRVPDFELYDDNGEAVMLSKFIPMTSAPNSKNYDEMSKNFVVDALLANWDIYKNDNCLVDSAGRIIRVDNGGALEFRAQGSKKKFSDSVTDFDSMIQYNKSVVANLTSQDYINQIEEVLKKRDDVVNFLNESGETDLAKTFNNRFKSLETIKKDLEAKLVKKQKKVLPRNLKSDAEMYRELSDDELNDIYKNTYGKDYYRKINSKNNNGWELLSLICAERGFDARPNVVSDAEYWNAVKQSKYQMFRGLASDVHDAEEYADDFKYNDNCFFGSIGIYGAGIYAHVNDGDNNKDNTQVSYKKSDAYHSARKYAGVGGTILELVLDPSAKVALVDDLKKEIKDLVDVNDPAILAKQGEIDNLNVQLKNKSDELNNLSAKTEEDIKKKMFWDEDTLVMHQVEIDAVDWGKLNDNFEPDYPSFDDFVKTKVFDWVKKNGGTVTEKGQNTDVFVFTLPNSKEKFMITRYQWENNAILQKNAFAKAYNYPLRRFQDWLMRSHYQVITKEIEKQTSDLSDKVVSLKKEIQSIKKNLNDKTEEIKKLKSPDDADTNFMSGIYKSVIEDHQKEAIGVYAAAKGYDAIIQPHGNGGHNSFMIILNRSKVIVKK